MAERDWAQFHTPENLAKSISIESGELLECFQWDAEDRKSTRLNSSHVASSYAVSCYRLSLRTLSPYTTLFRSPLRAIRCRTVLLDCQSDQRDRPPCPASIHGRTRLGSVPYPRESGQVDLHRVRRTARMLPVGRGRSEEHTSELQSRGQLVCRVLLPPLSSHALSLHDALPISSAGHPLSYGPVRLPE